MATSSSESNSRLGMAHFDPRRSLLRVWLEGKIFYAISPQGGPAFAERVQLALQRFRDTLTERNCKDLIRWLPRTIESDFVEFVPANSTHSFVGRKHGCQQICLAEWATERHILHEMCHALGLVHEHSRPDRLRVGVVVSGPAADPDFGEYGFPLGPYDKNSIMHYEAGPYCSGHVIGPCSARFGSEQLTAHDVQGLKAIYGKPCCSADLWDAPFPQPASDCFTCGIICCGYCARTVHAGHRAQPSRGPLYVFKCGTLATGQTTIEEDGVRRNQLLFGIALALAAVGVVGLRRLVAVKH